MWKDYIPSYCCCVVERVWKDCIANLGSCVVGYKGVLECGKATFL